LLGSKNDHLAEKTSSRPAIAATTSAVSSRRGGMVAIRIPRRAKGTILQELTGRYYPWLAVEDFGAHRAQRLAPERLVGCESVL
jgi:hypothetical protein